MTTEIRSPSEAIAKEMAIGIGDRAERKEDRRLVAGRGRFIDDIDPPGGLHATVLRSTRAHARLRNIDTDAALDVDGVVAVYTHEDLGPLDQPLPLGIPNPDLHHPVTQRPLAKDEVFFVGQPIALIVADSRELAEDAAAKIKVDYEVLPTVADLGVSDAGEVLAHESVPGNLAAEVVQSHGDAAKAIEGAPHAVELRLSVERGAAQPLETRGVIADWDPRDKFLRVYDTTQAPTTVRSGIAGFLGLRESQVEVVAPDVGGGFGVKLAYWYPEEILIPFASLRLGRPVKWVEDRLEHFVGSMHERGQLHRVRVGFDEEGRLLGLENHFLHDTGAFVPYGIIVPILTAARLTGPYKVPNYHSEFRVLYTNTVPVTPYRGAGQPQAAFVMERTMDAIARELDLDPVEVRRRNLILPEDFPYQPGAMDEDGEPATYDSGDLPAVLNETLRLLTDGEVDRCRAEAEARGNLVGVGYGAYMEITGGELYEGARVTIEPSGKVFVTLGASSQGQGHQTILAQVVAETLGASYDQIEVRTGDTRHFRWGVATFASRIAVIGGNAVARAADSVRKKALKLAAEVLEAPIDELDIVAGEVFARDSPEEAVSLRQLAILANPVRVAYEEAAQAASQFADRIIPAMDILGAPGLEATAFFAPDKPTYANGCHAAIVEVDPELCQIEILHYVAVHDCGRVINPTLVEGQIFGGVVQGIGGSFYEKIHYDESGQLVNGNFADYLLPYSSEVPRIVTGHVETPSPLNPLGLKGAGEAGLIPVAAAVVGAIEDATGVQIDEAPLSPQRLFELTREMI